MINLAHFKEKKLVILILLIWSSPAFGQNSKVGDGFGGRLWYTPYNYSANSYGGMAICGTEKELYIWGANNLGQFGDGASTVGSSIPLKIPMLKNVSYYSGGYFIACVLDDNSGYFWGGTPLAKPKKVLDSVRYVSAGSQGCSFVKLDGTVWSTGYNFNGVFGNNKIDSEVIFYDEPEQMIGINNAVRTACGQSTTIVLLSDGTVMSCGVNTYGTLGILDSTAKQAKIPQKVFGLKDIIDIKSNYSSNIALDKNGDVWQWGVTSYAILPDTQILFNSIPKKITTLKNIVAISGKDDGLHFLALDENHNCYAWMSNYFGQCAQPIATPELDSPILIANDVNDIIAAETFSYIIKKDGSLWSVGSSLTGYASIWLGLSDIKRTEFTLIDTKLPDLGLCEPKIMERPLPKLNKITDTTICIGDTIRIPIPKFCTVSITPLSNATINKSNGFMEFYGKSKISYTVVAIPDDVLLKRDTLQFTLSVYEYPVADFSFEKVEDSIFKFTNQSKNSTNYQWYYSDSLISDQTNLIKTFTNKGKHCIQLLATNQCGQKDSVTKCIEIFEAGKILIPNAFSPNKDGKNDWFKPIFINNLPIRYLLLIVNRYGEIMYQTTDYNSGWNGTFKNQDQEIGTYYYLIKAQFSNNINNEELYKGDINLIR